MEQKRIGLFVEEIERDRYCGTEGKVGSGKRRSARTTQNISAVEDLIVSQDSGRQTQNTSVNTADCTINWCVTEFCRTNCQRRPVAEMFQTTQSPGTDRIQQVGTFSPIATSETLPRARCCICVVYWWNDFHCHGAVKFAEWSCVCYSWYAEETDCYQPISLNTKHVQPVDHGIGRCL